MYCIIYEKGSDRPLFRKFFHSLQSAWRYCNYHGFYPVICK